MRTTKLIDILTHGRALWLVLALLAALTLGLSVLPRAVAAVLPDPIAAAWERTRAAGSYHFASDVIQQTIPSATISNVGRTSRTDKLRLEGQADLRRHFADLEAPCAFLRAQAGAEPDPNDDRDSVYCT